MKEPLPLHPQGTLRTLFGARAPGNTYDVFRRLGVGARRCDLGDEGLYLAEELVAADRWLGGSDPEALGILALALVIAQRQGSTRLSLDPKGTLRTLVHDVLRAAGIESDAGKIVKRIIALTAAPSFASVIGVRDDRRPLIVEDNCIYTERSRWLEQRVAERIAARTDKVERPELAAAVADLTARPSARPLSAEQLRAVELAATSRLAIVTGGPGTGKTLVATAIMRTLARLGVRPDRIALAAPTGKAANRLSEVIARELASIASPSELDRGLMAKPPVALTLHRLLGFRGNGFAHHERCPLPVDALLVDEASMIDLELVEGLLAALPATATLVLIGDAHQLPAVDAGQILADLADPLGPVNDRVARLAHSFRMDTSDPRGRAVFDAAEAILHGDTRSFGASVARTPGTLAFSGVEWVDSREPATARAVASAVWHHFDGPHAQRIANDTVFRFGNRTAPPFGGAAGQPQGPTGDGRIVPEQADELEHLWQLVSRARILAVTRGLPTGAIALNAHLHELSLARMTVGNKPDFVPGEPVMITANDYQRGLYNGDQGIIVRADEGGDAHRYRAIFRVAGAFVPFAIEALRDRLELAWALTVHKSQGSELEAVALVLPDEDLPLVTRELVYTGITRARTSVVICGPRAVIQAAGKRRALRDTGLAARIVATLAK